MIKIVSKGFMVFVSWLVGKSKDPYAAHALLGLPVVIVREKNLLKNRRLLNHEMIHFFQALYLGFVGFWVLYLCFWIYHSIRLKNAEKGYRANPFELEAYDNEKKLYVHTNSPALRMG